MFKDGRACIFDGIWSLFDVSDAFSKELTHFFLRDLCFILIYLFISIARFIFLARVRHNVIIFAFGPPQVDGPFRFEICRTRNPPIFAQRPPKRVPKRGRLVRVFAISGPFQSAETKLFRPQYSVHICSFSRLYIYIYICF